MLVTTLLSESVDKYQQKTNTELIVSADVGEIINFKKELSGESEKLLSIGKLSKTSGALVIGGYTTDNYGIIRRSAVVADKGSILGISDMNISFSDKVSLGYGYRVYQTAVGRIGVLVGDDLLCPESLFTLEKSDADLVVALPLAYNSIILSVLQAYAYLYAVPIISVNKDNLTIVNNEGNILVNTDKDISENNIIFKKKFTELTVKRRLVKK